jgi:mono/diheme cytochrome c family protein
MRRAVALSLLLLAAVDLCEAVNAETMTPLQRVASTPKGQLKNPYSDFTSVAEEGHRKYMAAGCNGCHGGGGGGWRPMPHFGDIIKTDDDLWKIIAWVRSVYCGRRAEGC